MLKVIKQEKQQKSFVFLAKKDEDEAILAKQGVNFSAYITLMKFANHVKVVCRDDNFENCLVVFDLIWAINSSVQEIMPNSKLKQIHVVLDAKNTFPSYLKFYSVELDESRQKTI